MHSTFKKAALQILFIGSPKKCILTLIHPVKQTRHCQGTAANFSERLWSNVGDTNNKKTEYRVILAIQPHYHQNKCHPSSFWKYSTLKMVLECQTWHEKHIKCQKACSLTLVEQWATAGKWQVQFFYICTWNHFGCIVEYEHSPKISVLFPSTHNVWYLAINNYRHWFCFSCPRRKRGGGVQFIETKETLTAAENQNAHLLRYIQKLKTSILCPSVLRLI